MPDALADLTAATVRKPEQFTAYLNLAEAYRDRYRDHKSPGDLDAAVAPLTKAIELQPTADLYRSRADLQALTAFRSVDFHLVDAHVEGMRGGTGQTVDRRIMLERLSEVPLILSGGLTAENVGAAIAEVGPFAVDVASGTEAEPGVKDPAKLRAFSEAVAAADAAAAPAEVAS